MRFRMTRTVTKRKGMCGYQPLLYITSLAGYSVPHSLLPRVAGDFILAPSSDKTGPSPGSRSLHKPRSQATRKRTRLSSDCPEANRRFPVRRACDVRRTRNFILSTIRNAARPDASPGVAPFPTVGRVKPLLAAVETCPSYDSFSPANSVLRDTMAGGSTIFASTPPSWQ